MSKAISQTFLKKTLGSRQLAEKVAQRTQESVPAYQHFLEHQGIIFGCNFSALPIIDKQSYILNYPTSELLTSDYDGAYTIRCSSGSSGRRYYWPQLQTDKKSTAVKLRMFLESTFSIHKKKSLAVMAMPLGGWVGSDSFDTALKYLVPELPYPFLTYSPGIQQDEVISIINAFDDSVEQIVLFILPWFIADLHLRAEQSGQSLPFEKIKYVVTGSPFPESLRLFLQRQSRIEANYPSMFSFYGSTDTGTLGAESRASVALRQLLHSNEALAKELDFGVPVPHFFHYTASDAFLETTKDGICITRWQGIPLVRYRLSDRVKFISWKEIKNRVLSSQSLTTEDSPWTKIITSTSDYLPDLIAFEGRTDHCLMLAGRTFTESMLDEVVKNIELRNVLTGLYKVNILIEDNRQYMVFDLETSPNIEVDALLDKRIYQALIQGLSQIDPIFSKNWELIYKIWDDNPQKRVLRLNYLPWPKLSESMGDQIKKRGIASGKVRK